MIFLPPKYYVLIQPLDQGVIVTFNTWRRFKRMLDTVDENLYTSVTMHWRIFSVTDYVTDIDKSLEKLKQQSTLVANKFGHNL